MQKRTNPLELKVDSKDYTPAPAPGAEKTENVAPAATESIAAAAAPAPAEPAASPKAADVAAPTPTQPAPAAAPAAQETTPPAAPSVNAAPAPAAQPTQEIKQPVKPAAPAAAAPAEPVGQPVTTVAPDRVSPVRPNRPAPPRPVLHNPAEDRVRRGEHVADNDVAVAVKFRVAGDRVERRMVLARVSKDVCKLAQALYPEQSMGQIIESALLTRAFLQDRDAFDAMAREIIQKGGKIKC